jgi:hypothetical protein
MVDKVTDTREARNEAEASRSLAHWIGTRWPVSTWAAAAFLFTVASMLISRQIERPEAGDSAIWDYVAQSIVRGQVPYRDVVEIKLPGTAYLSALAIWAGKLFGVRDLIAIRLLNIAMVGALASLTLAAAELYIGNRPVALISFLIPLTSQRFVEWMAEGSQPRLPMIVFGMLALVLIAKNRPFLAGVSSALSCICWQPGLLFFGVALLIFSRYFTIWRDLAALKVVAGAALPLAAMFLYFAWLGAVGDLWSWTLAYTFSVYAPAGFRGLIGNAGHLWNVTSRVLGPGIIVLALAVAGYLLLAREIVRSRRNAGTSLAGAADLYRDAILIAPLVYFLFCLIDFKSASYLIPAIPFIGIFGGLAVVKLIRYVSAGRFGRPFISGLAAEWLAVLAVLLLAIANVVSAGLAGDRRLQQQAAEFRSVSSLLGPEDQIYVHGATEILAVLDRPNLNPYIFLDNRKDEYIAARTAGGFQAIVDRMEAAAPKVVVLSSLNRIVHREELEAWVGSHYERNQSLSREIGYDVYVRKP